jgi:hypothetical protein
MMVAAPVIGTHVRTFEFPVVVTERLSRPPKETTRGRPTLTGVGTFLFISVPLIAGGALLI